MIKYDESMVARFRSECYKAHRRVTDLLGYGDLDEGERGAVPVRFEYDRGKGHVKFDYPERDEYKKFAVPPNEEFVRKT